MCLFIVAIYVLQLLTFDIVKKLAKVYHPDLNPNLPALISKNKMAEIIQAYEQLLDDDFLGVKVGDGRVALACEMFTLEELRMDSLHDVYSIRILFEGQKRVQSSNDEDIGAIRSNFEKSVSKEAMLEIVSHPEDSVSDLKRMIQDRFEEEWNLHGRRMDRDRIRTGWELICLDQRKRMKQDNNSDDELSCCGDYSLVMSYHLFVHSYDIQHGDIIHAVVRKYSE